MSLWTVVAVVALACMTACTDSGSGFGRPEAPSTDSDGTYDGSQAFKDDYNAFLNMMVVAEQFKMTFFNVTYDATAASNNDKVFGKDEISRTGIDELCAQMTSIAERYDKYKGSMERLAEQNVLGKLSTRSVRGGLNNMLEFFHVCKGAGTQARNTIVEVLNKVTETERQQLYKDLSTALRKDTKSYEEWKQLLGSGKIDYAANEIFKDFYYQSKTYTNGAFAKTCDGMGVTPNSRAYDCGTELWQAGALFVAQAMTSAARYPSGVNADRLKTLLSDAATVEETLKSWTNGDSMASNAANNLLDKDKKTSDAEKEKKRKALVEAGKNFYNNYKQSGRTTVTVTGDRSRAASIVVGLKNKDVVSVGIGASADGDLSAVLPTETNESAYFSLVNDEGGRITQQLTIMPGIDNATELMWLQAAETDLQFAVDGGKKTVKLDIKGYKNFGCKVEESDADWLSATTPDAKQCVVTVQANTAKERVAHILIYATNEDFITDFNSDNVATVRLTVTQLGVLGDMGIQEATLEATLKLTVRKDGTETTGLPLYTFNGTLLNTSTSQNMTVTTLSDGWHVEGVTDYPSDGSSTKKVTLSFDIRNVAHNFEQCTVSNLKFYDKYDGTDDSYVCSFDVSQFTVESVTPSGDDVTLLLKATQDNGAKIINFSYKNANEAQLYLVKNSDFTIKLTIKTKANN